ncbi:MAG: manganese transporter [Gemmatimonadales bacterium]|nr:MAG: manganese transporter [Gemmatimonadales bacterium]
MHRRVRSLRGPKPWPRRGPTRCLVIALALFAVIACGGDDPSAGDGIRVVTTIGMITDVVERVGGDRVSVQGLMGPGVDPHLYKASAGDVRRLAEAELIFYNGLHLEAAMGEVLAEMDGRTRTRAVTDALDRERLLTPPEFEGAYDPHVWSDVSMWISAVEVVRETLTEVDPEGAEEFERRAAEYIAELEELDEWVRSEIARVPDSLRVLVTAHDAFNYFGRAYGFEVRGLQGLSTATEAGTGDVQRLAEFIAQREIPALFIETSIPPRNIEAVRAAVRSRGFDVEIGGSLFSDAMGDPGTPEGTYPGMIRSNVRTIVDALTAGDG